MYNNFINLLTMKPEEYYPLDDKWNVCYGSQRYTLFEKQDRYFIAMGTWVRLGIELSREEYEYQKKLIEHNDNKEHANQYLYRLWELLAKRINN